MKEYLISWIESVHRTVTIEAKTTDQARLLGEQGDFGFPYDAELGSLSEPEIEELEDSTDEV